MAVAAYSSQHSRMWAWDSETLEILGFQDVKARVRLVDISPDGKYCSYFAHAPKRTQSYVAICRPPYFHALWIDNSWDNGRQYVYFGQDKVGRFQDVKHSYSGEYGDVFPTTKPNCPFDVIEIDEAGLKHWEEIVERRCSSFTRYVHDGKKLRWLQPEKWYGSDCQGREITIEDSTICADGAPFLDCRRQEFIPIPPPDWALGW